MQPSLFQTRSKPFLKWAGGKTQLLDQIRNYYPRQIPQGRITRYLEPFIGGGAVFFNIVNSYNFTDLIIADINPELILAYKTIQRDVEALIERLNMLHTQYLELTEEGRKLFFYQIRNAFNVERPSTNYKKFQKRWVERTAQIIFLNRTCFNGLFRVNSQGNFNVPFGKYKNPQICDINNLQAVSKALENVTILCGDFHIIRQYVNSSSFVYFDPPYRPISDTSSFTSYSKNTFNDKEQLRLAAFYQELDKLGARLMLSNSDPKNENPDDDFFEQAYSGFNIQRVTASRMINSKVSGRGIIYELLITNYENYAGT